MRPLKYHAVKKAVDKALKDPDFMLAVTRGQKAIKIDLEKVSDPPRIIQAQAKTHGFSTHIENNVCYLYVD